MNPFSVLFLAFLIGVVAGLRSLTAPAVVAWAAQRNWLNLRQTPLAFMGSSAAIAIFILLAVVELVADKLPSTPSRLKPPGLIARCISGGLSGAFAGHGVRTQLVKALKVPDFVIALLEDASAIAGGLLIVSRF